MGVVDEEGGRTADVIVENFRPGAMDRLGFAWEAMHALNPRLVYCSLKGFLSGPYEQRTALDEVAPDALYDLAGQSREFRESATGASVMIVLARVHLGAAALLSVGLWVLGQRAWTEAMGLPYLNFTAEPWVGEDDWQRRWFLNPFGWQLVFFTGFAFMPESYPLEVAVKAIILNAFWIPIHFLWLGAGVKIKQMALPDHLQRTINILMALAMLAVVGIALFAEFG